MMQRKTGSLTGILTLLDVDNFLRHRKGALRQALHDALQYCRKLGMTVGFVTGAPLQHVEHLTPVDIILAESGAVKVWNGELIVCEESRQSINRLLTHIGIPQYADGLFETVHGPILAEGRRHASFTALCEGSPPHYPEYRAIAPCKDIESWLSDAIRHLAVPLVLSAGNNDNYHWVDVINPKKTKSQSVFELLQDSPYPHVYYGGDANSDLQVVRENKCIIPLATNNCIAPMRHEAQQRGIYVDEDGPEGGVERVLCSIIDRHL